jgi:uncharacterized phage infection (PIP) family protein YhgE
MLVMMCVLGVASCSSTQPVNDTRANLSPKELELTRNKEFDRLTATYTHWSKVLKGAESLRVYAPENYREMISSWKSAHELFIEIRKDPNQIDSKHSVFSSETYAVGFRDRINTVEYNYRAIKGLKKQADALLAPAMTEMTYLNEIEAGRYFKHAMNTLSRDYQSLFEHLVVSEAELAASHQERFLENARALEVRVIDAKYVKPLEQRLASLASARYNVLAPVSYDYVEQRVHELSEFVNRAPRSFVDIDEQVERIDFQFRRLESVVQEVTKLVNVEKSQFEPFVLEAESRMYQISSVAKGNDYRDQPLLSQSNRIAHDVERIKAADNTRALKKENALLKQQISLLQKRYNGAAVSPEDAQAAKDAAAQNRAEIETLKKLVRALQEQAE